MSAGFTPGPWRVRKWSDKESGVVARIDGKWQDICGYSYNKNADLIAIAPELYEVTEDSIDILDVAIDLWNEAHPNEPDEVFTDLQQRFRTALAKARGEQS